MCAAEDENEEREEEAEQDPAAALRLVLEEPERVNQLDLDAFADELKRQGIGEKIITLNTIREELQGHYKVWLSCQQALAMELHNSPLLKSNWCECKSITLLLQEVRHELHSFPEFENDPESELEARNNARFTMLTKETPETFNKGRMVQARVMRIVRKTRAEVDEEMENLRKEKRHSGQEWTKEQEKLLRAKGEPHKDESGPYEGLYRCPICQRPGFPVR